MLLQFNFKNFKSFRDDATLDMTATKITELGGHVIPIGNEKVLPVASIYGANASGKSNIHEAFRYMATYVVSSFSFGGDEGGRRNKSEFLKPTPFLFDTSTKDAASSFEVYFITPEELGAKTYQYGFTVDQNGIQEEWLNYKSKSSRGNFKVIFSRKGETLDMPGIAPKSQENLKIALEKETLVVSLGAKLKIAKLKFIRDWFLGNEFANFGHPIENYFLSTQLPNGFIEQEAVQKKVLQYFSAFDPSIIGFNIETVESNDDNKATKVHIDAIHAMTDSNQTAAIPLKLESAGTLKMFAIYPLLQDVLESGGVLCIDELNARLHPLLVRTIVILFLDSETNANHAQLIFTTHDAFQLSSNILRRDEVWFVEKSESGISSLYSLVDFVDEDGSKIRKDENYEKNYLLGKYGAIPTMKAFDMFKETLRD